MAKHTKELSAAVKSAQVVADKLDELNEAINTADSGAKVLEAFNLCRQHYAELIAEAKGWGSLASIALGRLSDDFNVDPYQGEEAITDSDIDEIVEILGGGQGTECMAAEVANVLNGESGVDPNDGSADDDQGDIGDDGSNELAALLAALGMSADEDYSEEDEESEMVAASDEGFYSDDEEIDEDNDR